MKLLLLLTLILLGFYFLGFIKCEKDCVWMGRRFTEAMKGIGILSVIWAHAGATMGVEGIQFLAAIGVSIFLICSGFGLELSYQKNGLSHFWKKRFLKICIPFWIADCIGLLLIGKWTLSEFLGDSLFIHPNWYLQYIALCYILFWGIKRLKGKLNWSLKTEMICFFSLFFLWFLIESLFFAEPTMPFLRARQMAAFPLGMLLAKNKDGVKLALAKLNRSFKILICVFSGMTALLFVFLTQVLAGKSASNLITNSTSLLTVVPLALVVLLLGEALPVIFQSRFFTYTGILSYEIFLVQEFSLYLIKNSIVGTVLFLIVTYFAAWILHNAMKRRTKHG